MAPVRRPRTVGRMLFRRDPLRRCPDCRSRLACPTDWWELDDSHWHVDLRCPECGHGWDVVMHDRRAARYDVELDADRAVIMRAVRQLDLELMAESADAFVAALARNLIEPADFAT
jgi:hypothetical protein